MPTRLPPPARKPAERIVLPRRPNLLLAALPAEELRTLSSGMRGASWKLQQALNQPGNPIEEVYFPESGMYSTTVTMEDGGTVEVGGTGYEGMVGVPLFYEQTTPAAPVMCEVPGYVRALRTDRFRREMAKRGALYHVVARFAFALSVQTIQLAACNRLHTVEERLARWLLMTHDRLGVERFPLTQQFLAFMLGVHRPSVTLVARTLQQARLIDYRRGIVTIMDREMLEESACECYTVISDAFEPRRPRHHG